MVIMARNSGKMTLSKNLLQMKFMQRSALNQDKEEDADQNVIIDDEHWVLATGALAHQIPKQKKYSTSSNIASYMEVGIGRMSFKGFNPEVEHLTKEAEKFFENGCRSAEKRQRPKEDINDDISNEEMAEKFLASLPDTVARKFQKKRSKHTKESGDGE